MTGVDDAAVLGRGGGLALGVILGWTAVQLMVRFWHWEIEVDLGTVLVVFVLVVSASTVAGAWLADDNASPPPGQVDPVRRGPIAATPAAMARVPMLPKPITSWPGVLAPVDR